MPMTYSAKGKPGTLPEQSYIARPFFQTLLETAEALGTNRVAIAEALHTTPAALNQLPDMIEQARYLALLSAGQNLSRDENFGLHLGERVHPGTYSVLGFTLMSCATLGQALQQVFRFESLVHRLGRSSITLHKDCVAFQWHNHFQHTRWARDLTESTFSGLMTFANWLAGKPVPLMRVEFVHARPQSITEHQRLFNSAIQFACTENRICFPAYLANWPVIHADTSLFPLLEKHAEHLLQVKTQQAGIIGDVKKVLIQQLPQQQTQVAQIAQALNLTSRTLQRKLQAAGTRFQTVLDELRFDLARYYLRQSQLSVLEITFLLGYQTQSSFNHAFKAWAGISPLVYREQPCVQGEECGGF